MLGGMEKTELNVKLIRTIDESYPIIIGRKLNDEIAAFLERPEFLSRSVVVITDSTVADLAGQPLIEALAPRKAGLILFPAGEESKSRAIKEQIEDELISRGYGRDTLIIALGGGVVSDLAGFVAATFTRGVPYVAVSTTLLGAADAAVGGKTAVDTPVATNLIGAFHQPRAVFIDLDRWLTLAPRQIREGLGETVKHACIADSAFFARLEEAFVTRGMSVEEFVRDDELAQYTARRNCEIKRDFVVSDVHEGNRRMGLNLGHTIGRALETAAHFTLNHGECVAIGVSLQARLGMELGYCSREDVERIEGLYCAIGLPVSIPQGISQESIMNAMFHDKKSVGGSIRFVFQRGIGDLVIHEGGRYATPVGAEEMRDFLARHTALSAGA